MSEQILTKIKFIGTVDHFEAVGYNQYFIVQDLSRSYPMKGVLKGLVVVVLDGELAGTTYRILKHAADKNQIKVLDSKHPIYNSNLPFHIAIIDNETVNVTPEEYELLQAKARETTGLIEVVSDKKFEAGAEDGVLQETPDLRVQALPNDNEGPQPWQIQLQEGQVWGIRRFGKDPSTKEPIDTIEQCRRIISVSDKHGICFRTLGQRRVQTSSIERRNGKPEFEYREYGTTTIGVPNFRNWIRNTGAELIPSAAIVNP